MTQNNLYYKKGGKESPKLRAKNQKILTVYFRTKIWPYLGRGAKNKVSLISVTTFTGGWLGGVLTSAKVEVEVEAELGKK